MKTLLGIILAFACSASAMPILMMDTLAFNTVKHNHAKREYLKRLSPLLRDLKIKTVSFDAAKADHHELYELILKEESWREIMNAVTSACEGPRNTRLCANLTELRISTYAYIAQNPETKDQ